MSVFIVVMFLLRVYTFVNWIRATLVIRAYYAHPHLFSLDN